MSGGQGLPVVIVVAYARGGVIGGDNRLLWRLRTDLKRFRALTLGKPMIMGRKTFQSIGKPLPGRETVVVTRDPAFRAEGVHVAGSVEAALAEASRLAARIGANEIVIAGGGDIYAQTLAIADRIHATEVHADIAGDAFFPSIDPSQFAQVAREEHPAGPDDEHAFAFVDFARRR